MNTQRKIMVCQGINCRRQGAQDLMTHLQQQLQPEAGFQVTQYICFGACAVAPNIVVLPDCHWYSFAMPAYIDEVVAAIRRGEELPGLANHVRPEIKAAVFQSLCRKS